MNHKKRRRVQKITKIPRSFWEDLVDILHYQHTQGLFEGRRINFAKKIDEAAINDGAKLSILYSRRDSSAM